MTRAAVCSVLSFDISHPESTALQNKLFASSGGNALETQAIRENKRFFTRVSQIIIELDRPSLRSGSIRLLSVAIELDSFHPFVLLDRPALHSVVELDRPALHSVVV